MNNMHHTQAEAGSTAAAFSGSQKRLTPRADAPLEEFTPTDPPVSWKERACIFVFSVAITMVALTDGRAAHATELQPKGQFVPGALIAPADYEPWGVEIGGPCDKGIQQLGDSASQDLRPGRVRHVAVKPDDLFHGATSASLVCEGGRVTDLQIVWPTGRPGQPSARAALDLLAMRHQFGSSCHQEGVGYRAILSHGNLRILFQRPFDEGVYSVQYSKTPFMWPLPTPQGQAMGEAVRTVGKEAHWCSVEKR